MGTKSLETRSKDAIPVDVMLDYFLWGYAEGSVLRKDQRPWGY